MINLMPPNDRRQLAAARTNTLLLRYTLLSVFVIALLAVEMVGAYFVVNMSKAHDEQTISDNEQKTASYTAVKQQADAFRSNLATAKYILDRQVSYTTLMMGLANSLPSGAVIDKLSIDPSTFGTPTTLSVKTSSYDRAIEVKTALQNAKINNTPLFTSVSFQSVAEQPDAKGSYPITAVYNLTYSKAVLSQ